MVLGASFRACLQRGLQDAYQVGSGSLLVVGEIVNMKEVTVSDSRSNIELLEKIAELNTTIENLKVLSESQHNKIGDLSNRLASASAKIVNYEESDDYQEMYLKELESNYILKDLVSSFIRLLSSGIYKL